MSAWLATRRPQLERRNAGRLPRPHRRADGELTHHLHQPEGNCAHAIGWIVIVLGASTHTLGEKRGEERSNGQKRNSANSSMGARSDSTRLQPRQRWQRSRKMRWADSVQWTAGDTHTLSVLYADHAECAGETHSVEDEMKRMREHRSHRRISGGIGSLI